MLGPTVGREVGRGGVGVIDDGVALGLPENHVSY